METKDQQVTYIGYTNWRNQNIQFGIKAGDRLQHIYAIGRTGVGKSTLLINMAAQDILNGNGVAILDPHGDAAETLVTYVPDERKGDLVYLNAGDAQPIAFNPLDNTAREQNHLLASEIVSIFRKNWLDSWGVRLEYILRFCILTLLEYPGTTLLDIHPLLLNKEFRDKILLHVKDKGTLAFWRDEYEKYTPSQRNEAISSVLNKSGAFIANTAIKNILGQRTGSISIVDIVDNGKILIVNLSKGLIGEQACALLGSMITSSIQMAAMRKARLREMDRKPFYVFLDEAHSFMTPSFAQMLSECRKYKLGMFLTHQYLDQLTEDTRHAIIGNVGTMIAFRLGTKDARVFKDEMYPVFTAEDFINLPRYYFYIKLLINGVASRAFSAVSGEP
jgi:energy-coupling factor transporter ATP-binding protein EcfA2